jgi:hypothetical protein
MGEGVVLPDRDPPVRAEMVHESERTRITRRFLDGRTVICIPTLTSRFAMTESAELPLVKAQD